MTVLSRLFVPTESKRVNELVGIVMIAAAVLLLLSLASYSPLDRSLDTAAATPTGHATHNWIGLTGAYTADLALQFMGVVAFLVPLLIGLLALRWLRSRKVEGPVLKATSAATMVVLASALLSLLPWPLRWVHAVPIEGLMGRLLGDLMVQYLNLIGALIVGALATLVALYLATAFSISTAKLWFTTRLTFFFSLRDRWREWKEQRVRAKEARLLAKKQREREKQAQKEARRQAQIPPGETRISGASLAAEPEIMAPPNLRAADENEDWDLHPHRSASNAGLDLALHGAAAGASAVRAASVVSDAEPLAAAVAGVVAGATAATAAAGAITFGERADDANAATHTTMTRRQDGWKLPSSTLLNRPEARQVYDAAELKELAHALTEKCAEFGVLGSVVQINPGPVVTTFEFKPEAGIKYSRIVNLQDDLCLAMRAESILIERMPGKSTVGIQVPNEKRETIWLREVIESPQFVSRNSHLTIALGKDINGKLMTTELNTMPHLLIAGSTGSGKSVAINAFIMSMLYKSTPDEVRLILVDPKRVELGNYDGVPHLFTPIIAEPKQASNALRNAVREMERRLKLLAEKGVRNIDQYNKLFETGYTPSLFEDGTEEKPLPYIVIIVDELADLMMVDGANVEESITRLAQMARAIGIHLVLATQRPSVDVITGLLKANFPARMSFRVATKVDSRTILDANGAESLLGRGDMLYLPSGSSRVLRLHAPFVTEKEIAATVEFWKAQATAEYEHGFLAAPADEGNRVPEGGGEGDNNDPLYDDAVKLIFEFGKASTSLLQRRLRVGYGRAAHLIDMMEADGIVGPADGPKPREILKPASWLAEIENSEQ